MQVFGLSVGGSAGLSLDLGGEIASSAGISANAGAFSNLKNSASASVQLDPLRLIPSPAAGLSGDVASIQVGGQSTSSGSGFKAEVGVNADLRSRIQFQAGVG